MKPKEGGKGLSIWSKRDTVVSYIHLTSVDFGLFFYINFQFTPPPPRDILEHICYDFNDVELLEKLKPSLVVCKASLRFQKNTVIFEIEWNPSGINILN